MRPPSCGYAIIDSRSVKTAHAAQFSGFDEVKKFKGRKQRLPARRRAAVGRFCKAKLMNITTDTNSHLLNVRVHVANIHDTIAGDRIIAETKTKYPTIKGVIGDAGFRGTFKKTAESLGLTVDIIQRIADDGWQILSRR